MSITYEEVLNLFRETDRKFQESDRKFQEMNRETDRKFQEMNRETDRKFQEMNRETRLMFQESDRKFQEMNRETDRKFQETDRLVAALSKNIGNIGNRLGEFVEDMVKPAVVGLFRTRGLKVHSVIHGYEGSDGNEKFEVDLLVINGGDAIAVECKSRPSETDVLKHIERLGKIRRISPVVQGKKLMGAIAGMRMGDEVKELAQQQGLYVLVQNGDNIDIENPADFTPGNW